MSRSSLRRIARRPLVLALAWALLPAAVHAQSAASAEPDDDNGAEAHAGRGADAESRIEPPPLPERSELARVVDHPDRRQLEIVIGPVELEPRGDHVRLPIQLVEVPVEGWMHGFEWELRDGEGRRLPDELLHHVNLIDPDSRELFGPVSRRVVAAGRETGRQSLPRLLGYPLEAGTRFLIVSMFANRTEGEIRDAHLHVFLSYSTDRWIRPWTIYPFYMDVMGLVSERKDFALPPGRTVKSWEASPAIDGRILGIGGHVHDHATAIRLVDVTAGRVIWETEPRLGEDGRVEEVPSARLWWRGGVKIHRDRTYRIEVEYHNPYDEPLPDGGMGAIGGVVLAARGAEWPELDRGSFAYAEDLRHTLEKPFRDHGHGHGGHGEDGRHDDGHGDPQRADGPDRAWEDGERADEGHAHESDDQRRGHDSHEGPNEESPEGHED